MISASMPSRFEAAWAAVPPGARLKMIRQAVYDPSARIVYAPAEFSCEEADTASDVLPDVQWVADSFLSFVRGEFSTGTLRGPCPPEPEVRESAYAHDDVARKYRDGCEERLVYSGYVDGVMARGGATVEENVLAILSDRTLGNVANTRNIDKSSFLHMVAERNGTSSRLQFILPAFPFKDQNIFRTNTRPEQPDLAEVALLVRLHALTLALYQAHPYGVDWIIASDGTAYADILGVDEASALEYRRRLVSLRSLLNMQRTVHLIDLRECTGRLISHSRGGQIFDDTVRHLESALEGLIVAQQGECWEQFRVLVRGIKWNMSFRSLLRESSISREDLWAVLDAPSSDLVDGRLRNIWNECNDRAERAALRYAGFNLGLRYHSVLDRLFPGSLRATIHPKKGQIAVPTIGRVFPWNGVGVLKDLRFAPDSIECVELFKACSVHGPLREWRAPGTADPLYYEPFGKDR